MTDWLENYGTIDPVGAAVFTEFMTGPDEKFLTTASHPDKDPKKGHPQAGVWIFLTGRMDRPEPRKVDSRIFSLGGVAALMGFEPIYTTRVGELQSEEYMPSTQSDREALLRDDGDVLRATDQELRADQSRLLGGFLLWHFDDEPQGVATLFISSTFVKNYQLSLRESSLKVEQSHSQLIKDDPDRLERIKLAKTLSPKLRTEARFLLGLIMPTPDEINERIRRMTTDETTVFDSRASNLHSINMASDRQDSRSSIERKNKNKASKRSRKQNRKRK